MRYTILSAGAMVLLGSGLANAADCAPANGTEFVCSVDNVEHFAQLPNEQIIGSDLAVPGKQGFFFVFNPDRSVHAIQPEDIAIAADSAYAQCPGAPDWKQFGPYGIDVVMAGNTGTLYAANHGGREAIEICGVELADKAPKLTWKGCLIAPKGAWPDDVAALPDGGLAVTSLWDPEDDGWVDKLVTGKPVGGLFEWHPGPGWSVVQGSESISGPNGVIAMNRTGYAGGSNF